jgi:hypothetical protein
MIHRQLGNTRSVKGAASFACAGLFGFLIGGSSGPASAGDFDRATLPAAIAEPEQCDSGGEGPGVLKDSGDCRRISGYIAAGARLGTDDEFGGRPSVFGPLDAPQFVGGLRPSGAAIIDAPACRGFVFPPPGLADEAR